MNQKKKVRDFPNFKYDISQVNLDGLFLNNNNNADKIFSSFYKKLNKIIYQHAPFKILSKRKLRQLSKPWITKGIKTSIKMKNKLNTLGDNV